jgi:hypothetical protein
MDRTRRIGFAIFVALSLVMLTLPLWAPPAKAAPRAQSAEECTLIADMAVVARALAEEKVDQALAEPIMLRIYDLKPRGLEMLRAVIVASFAQNESAEAWSAKVHLTCMVRGGYLDSILGTPL